MLTDQRVEPIAADARLKHDGKDIAKLKVVAGLLGLGVDEIVCRAERAGRKRVRNWGAALIVLTATFAGLAIWAEINRREARRETIRTKENLASALTALALTELEQRPVDAAKLALAAWPRPGTTDLPKREVTLNTVVRSLAALHEQIRITTDDIIASVGDSPDGARVVTVDRTARLWDAETGKEIRAFNKHDTYSSVAISADSARVLTGSWDNGPPLGHRDWSGTPRLQGAR